MSLLSFFIPTAYAAANTASTQQVPHASPWSTVIMLGVFFAIFYFVLIRPQQKRAKQQRELLGSLGKGDEVVTSSGIIGRITDIEDNIVSLEIAKNTTIKIQKNAVSSTLPKGTFKD